MKNGITIHQICQLYHIGPDSIRYYEKIGLIHPQRDPNGYRRYGIQELYHLNVIRDLLALGFTTNQIRSYLDHRSVQSTLQLLDEEEKIIENQIAMLRHKQHLVRHRRQSIVQACTLPCGTIQKVTFPLRQCVTLREKIEQNEDIETLLVRLSSTLEKDPSIIGNCDTGAFLEPDAAKAFHYTSVFIVRSEGPADFILPPGDYLTLTRCANNDAAEDLKQLQKALQEEQLETSGPFLEFLLIDRHETCNPAERRTQIQVKIQSKKYEL